MELQTAQRKGFTTSLRWLEVDGRKLLAVIDEHQKRHEVSGPKDVAKYYQPVGSTDSDATSLFSEFQWAGKKQTSKPKQEQSVKEPKPLKEKEKSNNAPKKKKNSKKDTTSKESTAIMAEATSEAPIIKTGGNVKFSETVETIYELQGSYRGVLVYSMEFEEWDDFQYRYNKMKEKYPYYNFVCKTSRAVVSYEKLI